MKRIAALALIVVVTGGAIASNMMGAHAPTKSHGAPQGTDMANKSQGVKQTDETHTVAAKVKDVSRSKGTVTLAHGPVKSLKWPPMTMRFSVKDKALFDKLVVASEVQIEFVQQGSEYVVTSVK
jgi:Cu(I)/Ag(I) efflux system protein CusF